jgi:hypothetical protein
MNLTTTTSKDKSEDNSVSDNYLERKYGKEPRISEEELEKNRWNWH